jgi:hypothetical protein
MKRLTVTPAYGRDYKSQKAVQADWDAGKDFIIANFFDPADGKPINKQDADRGGIKVMVRYQRLTKIYNVK